MLKAISEVVGSKLVDLDKSQTIGEVSNWVIDPRLRRLTALIVKQPGLFAKTRVVTTTDIIEYGPRIVVVKNESTVISPDEVSGLPQLLQSHYRIMRERVETKSGKPIGVVEDVLFETTDSSLQKFYIKPSLLGLATRPDIILGIDKILEIQPKRIIVSDDVDAPTGTTSPAQASI